MVPLPPLSHTFGRAPSSSTMEPDEYKKQLHILEAGWKPSDRCGTPGCTLPDFHEGLCSTEQVLGRRKRPAPAAPARESGSERGGGRKKHDRILLGDVGASQDDDVSHGDDDDSLSLQPSAATGPDPDPEGFLEGEEERLYAQLAAVRARKAALAAGQGGDKSAAGIEAMGSYTAATPHLRRAPTPAPAPTTAPTAPTATTATAATSSTAATPAIATVAPPHPPPPLAQRQNSLPGPRPWSAWASLELRSLLGEWHLAEQAADIVEHSGAKSVLELETCADLKREVCPLCPLRALRALCALCALRTNATPCALRWRRALASSRCRRAGSTSCSPS